MEDILLDGLSRGFTYSSANEFYEAFLKSHPISDGALNEHRWNRDRAMIDRLQDKYADKWK